MIKTPKRKRDDKPRRWRWGIVSLICLTIGVMAVVMIDQVGCHLPAVPWPSQNTFTLRGVHDYRFDLTTHLLTPIRAGNRSPDGQWQASWISSGGMDYSRFLMLTSTPYSDVPQSLGRFYGAGETLSWSPDSQWLAVSAYSSPNGRWRPEKLNLLLVNITTGDVKPLVTTLGRDDLPLFSPDGQMIAYRHEKQLWVVTLSTKDVQPVLTQEVDAFGWSDDGQFLVALPSRRASSDQPQIWLVRADGLGSQSITHANFVS